MIVPRVGDVILHLFSHEVFKFSATKDHRIEAGAFIFVIATISTNENSRDGFTRFWLNDAMAEFVENDTVNFVNFRRNESIGYFQTILTETILHEILCHSELCANDGDTFEAALFTLVGNAIADVYERNGLI